MSLLFIHHKFKELSIFCGCRTDFVTEFLYGLYHCDITLNDYFRQQQNELSSTKWLFLRMRMT